MKTHKRQKTPQKKKSQQKQQRLTPAEYANQF